jgi:uncharacterized protein (TIGR03382 family)
VNGICTIYPKGAGTLTCVNGGQVPAEEDTGGCSCGNAGGTELLGLLGMLGWVGARARRRVRVG